MQHLDEGVIHAWIDGELPPDEAARVEAHAASCASCGAMVAEARGLVAASSRIVSVLDSLPRAQRGASNGMLPAFGARKTPRRWMTAKWTSAIAATLVIAAGTVMTVRGRVESPVAAPKVDPVVSAPLVRPALNPPNAVPNAQAMSTRSPMTGSPASPMAAAKPDIQTGNVAATAAEPARIDSVAKVAAPLPTDSAQVRRSPAVLGGVAGASAGAGAALAVAGATAGPRRNADLGRNLASVMVTGLNESYVGCYEVNESTDVLPSRFALRADSVRAGVERLHEVRYVDSTGVVDGLMVDAGWTESGGTVVIRTTRMGDVLTIRRAGNAIVAQSPLGPRTVLMTACHVR